MDLVIDVLSWACILSGALFMIAAGIGVLRLPDVYTRAHAAGLKDTMGVALTIIGLMLQAGLTLITVKLLILWLFLWFTSPVAGHAVARAALFSGLKPIIGRGPSASVAEIPGPESSDWSGL